MAAPNMSIRPTGEGWNWDPYRNLWTRRTMQEIEAQFGPKPATDTSPAQPAAADQNFIGLTPYQVSERLGTQLSGPPGATPWNLGVPGATNPEQPTQTYQPPPSPVQQSFPQQPYTPHHSIPQNPVEQQQPEPVQAPVEPPKPEVDYDSLIANDPEYQLLLRRLEAAMANSESDAGAETSSIRAQTLRRLQQLREGGQGALKNSNEDFASRGLGFSGGFLEDQGNIRRQLATGETDLQSDETSRIADLQRQLLGNKRDIELQKQQGLVQTGQKVRGLAGSLSPSLGQVSSIKAAQPQVEAPTVVSPAAVQRRLGSTASPLPDTGVGGTLNRKRRPGQTLL